MHSMRQVGLLGGVAAAIAIGVAVGLWSFKPGYEVLYGGLGDREVSQIMEVLQRQNIDFRLNDKSGAIMIPAGKVREVRLVLASEGLPKSSGMGLEILQKKQEFGTSQFMELNRYKHALETELARSIMTMSSVETARVHLALPKQSVFIRKRQQPSASVLLNLYGGRSLEEGQVTAITHLVASSIPNMEPGRVTVVNERGQLLSRSGRSSEMAMSQDQFEYTHKLEKEYADRIEDILAPIVGLAGVRAKVNAELDFTVTEMTQETYNPDLPSLRSEQLFEESSTTGGPGGIPGALSNQPPGAASVPEMLGATGEGVEQPQPPVNSTRRSTANYELDRTISHSRMASGALKRLSIAVVVDDRVTVNEDGEITREPRSSEEIERITSLVKEAVGYNAVRGDTVNVINASFTTPEAFEPPPEAPIWEQSWVMDIAKLVLGSFIVLFLILGVLRPMLRNLAAARQVHALPAGAGALPEGMAEDQVSISGADLVKLPEPGAYEGNVKMVQKAAKDDPKLVAQVVKNWVTEG